MTISEQVQNDYTVAWQVIGPMARQLSLGELAWEPVLSLRGILEPENMKS